MLSLRHANILFRILVGMLACSCSSSMLNSGPPDCGYSAYYDSKDSTGKIEILFSLITAEGNEARNCGFNYIKTKVDQAEVNGTMMPERSETDQFKQNTYFYSAPTGFDMQRDVITIRVSQKRYASDLATFQKIGTSNHVKLKRAD
jgi:hypothetical protein